MQSSTAFTSPLIMIYLFILFFVVWCHPPPSVVGRSISLLVLVGFCHLWLDSHIRPYFCFIVLLPACEVRLFFL